MMFTPSKMLQNYLSAQPRDMFDIVGALMGYINADPQFKSNDFEQAIQYVLTHGVSEEELFATFDASIDFENDSSKWDGEYYSFARVYLKDNFCKKRINHVKAVARKLYPAVAPKLVAPKPVAQTERQTAQVSAQTGGTQSSVKKSQSQQSRQIEEKLSPVVPIVAVVVIILLAVIIVKLLTK